jgi:hypothetical protein
MTHALLDWLSKPINVVVPLDSSISKDVIRTAAKELRVLKKNGKLIEYLMKRVIPYLSNTDRGS